MVGPASTRRLGDLRAAKDLMDASFAAELDLGQVAAAAGYSAFHFSRAFQQAYGESPGRYLTRRRIERAQDLLRGSDLTVTEICLAVGFSSLGSFSTTFRRAVGSSPTAYREAARADRGLAVVPACALLMRATPSLPRAPRG